MGENAPIDQKEKMRNFLLTNGAFFGKIHLALSVMRGAENQMGA